ncbi:DNA binding protein [Pseudomonas syringae]|uniref:DNA binding protein n=1 Tax=Pseudomonas syringae TaxID=317 RepID=UPI000A48AA4B|nr:DNA binding protein [Pseudomonas syringae]
MQNYSDSWLHLQSVLTGSIRIDHAPEVNTLKDHVEAKILAIILANAELATPKLNRENVEKILSSQYIWPNLNTPTLPVKQGPPLSFYEELGLFSFFGDWCHVHCRTPRNIENLDSSLTPLIESITLIKNIAYGWDGFVRPHFILEKNKAKELTKDILSSSSSLSDIPGLSCDKDSYKIEPGNNNFSSLTSTYLWQSLRERKNTRESFDHWLLVLSANCSWAMPILFEYLDHDERKLFSNELIDFLEHDTSLKGRLKNFWRQNINEEYFDGLISPVQYSISLNLDNSGQSSREEKTENLRKVILEELPNVYSDVPEQFESNLELVSELHKRKHWRGHEVFYSGLIKKIIESDLKIDNNSLSSHGLTEALLQLSEQRPILKHILFNLLPGIYNVDYTLYLLSRPETADVAFFHLSQINLIRKFNTDQTASNKLLESHYQHLICSQFLKAGSEPPYIGEYLFSILCMLGDRCDMRDNKYTERYEHRFLPTLLEKLSDAQTLDLASHLLGFISPSEFIRLTKPDSHLMYYILFWLMEKIESRGLDIEKNTGGKLQLLIVKIYNYHFDKIHIKEFNDLKANSFFDTLPWYKISDPECIKKLLKISSKYANWNTLLSYSSERTINAVYAIQSYAQLLMCISPPEKVLDSWCRVSRRVLALVTDLGFRSDETHAYIFGEYIISTDYDLWSKLCTYINASEDEIFDDFIERNGDIIPLNKLFILLETCSRFSRQKVLLDIIIDKERVDDQTLSNLPAIEQAFISACHASHFLLADELYTAANAFLYDKRFKNSKAPQIISMRNNWKTLGYKLSLLKILEETGDDAEEFQSRAHEYKSPFEATSASTPNLKLGDDEKKQKVECQRFRRYIIAVANLKSNPAKCVAIMNALCKDFKSDIYHYQLFAGKIALLDTTSEKAPYRAALTIFLSHISHVSPDRMPHAWVALILECLRKLHDYQEMETFWSALTHDQRYRLEIIRPYCSSLVDQGEALKAQKILSQFKTLNLNPLIDFNLIELNNEIFKALPSEYSLPISQIVELATNVSQRNIGQLTNSYKDITTRSFEEYVEVVSGQKTPIHIYLRTIITEIGNELLLRKKNLHTFHLGDVANAASHHIAKEDLINDWFTSLFDKRMADARVGCRDQKRGGESASGEGPGEIDGFITTAKNIRIAIFEAFRLFSNDSSVIFEHLNKVSGYDNESLSPVIVMAYCSVKNFSKHCDSYFKLVTKNQYTGFDRSPSYIMVRVLDDISFKIGMEVRLRGIKEIVIYHFLLDMYFGSKDDGKIEIGSQRATQVFVNPHTGERAETKSGTSKILKLWKDMHGNETVRSWRIS